MLYAFYEHVHGFVSDQLSTCMVQKNLSVWYAI